VLNLIIPKKILLYRTIQGEHKWFLPFRKYIVKQSGNIKQPNTTILYYSWQNFYYLVRFEVITEVTAKSMTVWVLTLGTSEVAQRFGGNYNLRLQILIVSQAWNQQESRRSACCLFITGFLLRLSGQRRNVNYTALQYLKMVIFLHFTVKSSSICAPVVMLYTSSWYSSSIHIFLSKGNFSFYSNYLIHRTLCIIRKLMF
jgi:hypothetical protein